MPLNAISKTRQTKTLPNVSLTCLEFVLYALLLCFTLFMIQGLV